MGYVYILAALFTLMHKAYKKRKPFQFLTSTLQVSDVKVLQQANMSFLPLPLALA